MLIEAMITGSGSDARPSTEKPNTMPASASADQDETAQVERRDRLLADIGDVDIDQDQAGDADRQVRKKIHGQDK